MKKHHLFLIFIFSFFFVIHGCKKDNKVNKEIISNTFIEGIWDGRFGNINDTTNFTGNISFTFLSNGKVSSSTNGCFGPNTTYGTYKITGDSIITSLQVFYVRFKLNNNSKSMDGKIIINSNTNYAIHLDKQ